MARRYLIDPLPAPGPTRLPSELGHHVGRVLRARPGERLVLFDGRGAECEATVLRRGRAGEVEVLVGEPQASLPDRDDQPRIHLAFALARGPRADWLFEHGTEVGVAAFHPIRTERSRPARDRRERWQRIVAAAAGQCGRRVLPAIHPPCTLAGLLADSTLPAERYLAQPEAEPLTAAASEAALLLVGPEGGFSPAEVEAAVAAGCLPRGLGRHVLRTETAALAGAVRLLADPPPK